MPANSFKLPASAAAKFHVLNDRWHEIAETRLPGEQDFPTGEGKSLPASFLIVEPVYTDGEIQDLKHLRASPDFSQPPDLIPKGKTYAEAFHESVLPRKLAIYRNAAETGKPHYWEVAHTLFGNSTLHYSRLLLPLYDSTGKVTRFLVSLDWQD